MIRKLLGKFLMMMTEGMVTASPASMASVGVEEMPESMKKLR
ncbi:hypothetical protein UT300005_18660 [Clostridium sp. CTA-5]